MGIRQKRKKRGEKRTDGERKNRVKGGKIKEGVNDKENYNFGFKLKNYQLNVYFIPLNKKIKIQFIKSDGHSKDPVWHYT